MFGWIFGKKNKPPVKQESTVKSTRNTVTQTTIVNQRGAKASGDIVGGNKYSTYRRETPSSTYDPLTDPFSPLNPISPLNPLNQPDYDPPKHSHDSGSSWSSHSHDSSSSSSYDSGSSSSYDSGSSYSSSSD